MSLRAFHIVFVLVSILLSLYVTLWGVREFAKESSAAGLVLAVLFSASGVALAIYGRKAFRKLRELP